MAGDASRWVRAVALSELEPGRCSVAHVDGHTLAIVRDGERVYAIDNRCPHMGFPMHRGSVRDGIIICHWHHARFDLCTGGTFDQWADDVRAFPAEIRDGDVWIDLAPRVDVIAHQRERLQVGLERNISLVTGKAVLALHEREHDDLEPFRIGLEFGTRYRDTGWSAGLTIHTCMHKLQPHLDAADRPHAVWHGLAAVANDCDGRPPRFLLPPLPGNEVDPATLQRWLRRFIEVRDAEGAERCVVSAIRSGATPTQVADMLFAAVTDRRYIDVGHPLDFTNKAFEALDAAGWDRAEPVLTSLIAGYASAERMEESNAWRHPIDLIALLEAAFEKLPQALEEGRKNSGRWSAPVDLTTTLLAEDPAAIVEALLVALRAGALPVQLAGEITYAAARRIAHFPTSNELGDWDTALHTFTFANAVQSALRRSTSIELLRGVFDAAMSVYLDRFLNVPAVPLPDLESLRHEKASAGDDLLAQLPELLDQRNQVNAAARLVARYLANGGDAKPLMAMLGRLLLREDRDFHTIQCIEAAFHQHEQLKTAHPEAAAHMLIAATRYLAAHAPTLRAQNQTYRIATRLHRGEQVFEGVEIE